MGYVEETGVAQHYRDARIAAIYEGTNGIQAADLVGRKLVMRNGGVVGDLLDELEANASQVASVAGLGGFAAALSAALAAARRATEHLLAVGATDQRALHAAATPYLRLLGTTVCAGLLAKGALAASRHADDFHRGKVIAAKYFGEQIVPVACGLLPAIEAGSADLDAITL
jgi:acyl-CoA dehydrogenase